MSAQVTEAHRELARRIMFEFTQAGTATASDVRMAAQIIADSEARAVAAVNASLDAAIIRAWGISSERDQLRTERNNLRADLDAIKAIRDEETARAERAEAELATERAIVSRIWVQLGSPTYEQLKGRSIYDLIDEMRAELAIEREKSERYRLASLKLDAELAAERAKVRVLRDACEGICEEWGRNHDANPIGAGQKMETLASNALEDMEDAT